MKDNFSQSSDLYRQYRPEYPKELFEYILRNLSHKDNVWDCGTGSGQLAKELCKSFVRVHATDISVQQLSNAEKAENITYSKQPAESTNFLHDFFDLITVGQAVHWFDFEKFYAEVNRTLKADGVIAILGYGKLQIDKEIDTIIDKLYFDILGTYWDKERRYIDENYLTIPFPFKEIKSPDFSNKYYWSLEQLIGYLETWSALKHYKAQTHEDPMKQIRNELQQHWAEGAKKEINFPVLTRIGKRA